MWTRKVKLLSIHGASQSSSLSSLQALIRAHFSTKSTPKHPIHRPHFMIDYLVKTLAFSKDQAFSVSAKVNHLKSTKNPDSVVDFFKQCGLDKTQIRNILTSSPTLLTTSVDKTLVPKFRVFQELGLSGSDLEKVFKPSKNISRNRLDANVCYLRKLLGSDEKVVKVITRSWWFLSKNFPEILSRNLLVMKKYGLSNDKIENFLVRNPGYLLQSSLWLEETIQKVEPVLGISPESPRFVDGFEIIASMRKSTIDMKFEIFRSFGWPDSDIFTMTRALPFCVRGSEAKIRIMLTFLMKDLGLTSGYLAKHPKLLVYSLEKRVLPRNMVLEILKEKKLLKNNFSLCSVVALSEAKFVKLFVMPYLDRLPDLYEVYTKESK